MYFLRFLIMFLFMLIVSSVAVCAENDIVAEVEGVQISRFELDREINRILPFRVNYHGKVSDERKTEIKEEALELLIERAYKITYAINNDITVSEYEIDARVVAAKKKFKTEEAFQKAIGDESVKELKNSIRRHMLASAAERKVVNDNVRVSDSDVEKFYETNKHMYLKPRQFRASQIFIKVDPAATKKVREELFAKAESLLKQARSGKDFYNLAYYNSDDKNKFVGGDLGFFHEGQAGKPIENALLNLEVGDISDIVETLDGYHILKLTDSKPATQLTYDEVSLKIKTMLEKKQKDSLYKAWMDKLKETYKVKRYDV